MLGSADHLLLEHVFIFVFSVCMEDRNVLLTDSTGWPPKNYAANF